MEKVVYLLGAGFSAPLGLPVMSNFILKAKDMYFRDTARYSHFKEVFDLLNSMAIIKNYFDADLYNIEEILSIFEMNDYLSNNRNSEKFQKFLIDVIEYYTPKHIPFKGGNLPSNWHDFIHGSGKENDINYQRLYGTFVAEMFNLRIRDMNERERIIKIERTEERGTNYSLITLNYDLVLENAIRFLRDEYIVSHQIKFSDNLEDNPIEEPVYLSKLHGCVEKANIVPPTWNKASNENLLETWKLAQIQLQNANHIRIIGYSLPITDSYMKYMFKSSLLHSQHLKTIDVITLDPNGEVKKRYDQFIDFNYYKFKNGNIIDYLRELLILTTRVHNSERVYISNYLEKAHEEFMAKN